MTFEVLSPLPEADWLSWECSDLCLGFGGCVHRHFWICMWRLMGKVPRTAAPLWGLVHSETAVKCRDFLDGRLSLKVCSQHACCSILFLNCVFLVLFPTRLPFLSGLSNLSKASVTAARQLLAVSLNSVVTNDRTPSLQCLYVPGPNLCPGTVWGIHRLPMHETNTGEL